MSTILALVGPELPADPVIGDILSRMSGAGGERRIRRVPGAAFAAERPAWQAAEGMNSGEGIASRDGVTVVADASIYYQADLRRALQAAGETAGEGPAELVAAAYRAWGEACVDRLEGDWAFVLRDEATGTTLAARDFGGRRPLHYAVVGGTLVIASTLAGVLAFPGCDGELNLVSIADTVAGLMASSHETCYRAVSRLNAGYTLRWSDGRVVTYRHWNPAPREDRGGLPFDEAALHLRELLTAAITERLSRTGLTTVQLSGGWDSTAIYGVGQALLAQRPELGPLLPVSISYPPGDPGREDEIIEMILKHWGTRTHWLHSKDIDLFDHESYPAGAREEPFSHVYEIWNRRLVQAGRELGSRVMFDGFGGDSLFQCSPLYFSDLLRAGRLRELRSEWKSKGMKGPRAAFEWCIQPLLPLPVRRALADVAGGRVVRLPFERDVPPWVDGAFASSHGLMDRERARTPRYGGDTASSDEIHWHLTNQWIPRMLAENFSFGMDEGLEMRSPLWDRRIVEFAMNRPSEERSRRKETKRLLRRAGKGLLPDDVLAPRRYRTGMTTGFFERHMRAELTRARDAELRSPVLADLGLVDGAALRRAVEGYLEQPRPATGVQLFFTLNTELWLRARSGVSPERPAGAGLAAAR